jgi:hypothetical protein
VLGINKRIRAHTIGWTIAALSLLAVYLIGHGQGVKIQPESTPGDIRAAGDSITIHGNKLLFKPFKHQQILQTPQDSNIHNPPSADLARMPQPPALLPGKVRASVAETNEEPAK